MVVTCERREIWGFSGKTGSTAESEVMVTAC
jgi:hypothetical protein